MWIIGWFVGILTGCAAYHYSTRRQRRINELRELFLKEQLAAADKFPGGREYVRIPYNLFCSGAWVAEHSKHYPRKEYSNMHGVIESA
jgi:hypothetical protein